ncbi:MAG: tripartite tricarboxylate transporter permease [Deltaproteobacteria bacterium]|nr:tripartite tricarboxylate transporter permease [Deltaproteobacteria bacterium]MBW1954395.1 tripartite tricarboxylate transporter permease [Deltaproteobacteria bacterium]MBW2041505.1 tripartite tricarboxylate transporter permease [Deltaproteobacteria bacterium]MBW2131604.1 tripartite tricarboxylate transporter permease [Deltaproteobacteria bacterium]
MGEHVIQGIQAALTLSNLGALVAGTFVGIVVGILPGVGPMVGMVVLLPFTFAFSPDVALSLLLGVFCGGYFGGAVPAILMRTPGVPSSLITSFDGFPLTQKGEAQTALSAALLGSFGGGIISVVILIFLAPVLAHVAASFGPPEYFSAGLLGVVLVVMAYRKQLARGLLLLGLGLWFSTVGIDGTTLSARFTFGVWSMQNGLDLVAICLGLFGIGQTLLLVERTILQATTMNLTRSTLDFSKLRSAMRHWKTLGVSGVIGTFVGLLPGTGSILASFLSYETAKRTSRHPETFGRGAPEGCMAAEAGNNAVPAGAMIPLLTLGIPGEALSAVLLGVFTINGIYPGPLLLIKEPVLINTLYFSMILINVAAFVMLALWLRPFAMIVRVPTALLSVSIMVISLTGIYAVNTRLFDAGVAVVMGVLGYILLRMRWPVVNLVMGVVLGEILENRLRQSLSLGDGSPMIFLTRPISLGLILAAGLIIVIPLVVDRRRKAKAETPWP